MTTHDTQLTISARDNTAQSFKKISGNLNDIGNAAGGIVPQIGMVQGAFQSLSSMMAMNPLLAVAGGAAAAAGALGNLTHSASNSMKETENLARIAGVSYQEFERLEYATSSYGVTAEKLSDNLKDVNDRLGQFATDGTGALNDAFNAAGVNAEQMRKKLDGLEGVEALKVIKTELDAAGVSAAQQTFVFESLANDLSGWAPLLAENGAALSALGDEHDRLAGIVSNDTLAANNEYQESLKQLKASGEGLARDFFPILIEGMGAIAEAARWVLGLWKAQIKVFADIRQAITETGEKIAEFVGQFSFLQETFDSVTDAGADFLAWGKDVIGVQEKSDTAFGKAKTAVTDYLSELWKATGIEIEPVKVKDTGDSGQQNNLQKLSEAEKKAAKEKEAREAAEKKAREKKAAEEKKLADARLKNARQVSNEIVKLTGSETEKISNQFEVQRQKYQQMLNNKTLSREDFDKVMVALNEAEQQKIAEFNSKQEEAAQAQLEADEKTRRESLSSFERMLEDMEDSKGSYDDMVVNMTERFTEGFGDAFSDAIMGAEDFSDAMENVGKGMLSSLLSALGEYLAQEMIMMLFSSEKKKQVQAEDGQTRISDSIARSNEIAMKSYDAMADIPVVGPILGAAAAAASWAFSLPIISSIKSALGGAAHGGLGYVPQESTYLLQRGERVLSPNQNADLTSYLANGGGGMNITINGGNASPEAIARAVGRALSKRNKSVDSAVARASQRGMRNKGVAYA
ncbi:hypothetical protein L2750_14475 [Shewanella submarina]|uniref:Bacteriophage tail tape measure C-terminal domain-containing protein n=1 Tax=Shewanella submarina TaxID=2016376 RepID=A0ABV7G9D4_9GAMM|nr:hypothetical protein [Shewanella submarina]MCL1038336.1 hypothetical protein [Shewanella submarina]